MLRLNAANDARTTLASNVSLEDTTISVSDSSDFPEPPFRIVVGREIMEVSEMNGNIWTVERGLEGTLVLTHNSGSPVTNEWTAGTYDEIKDTVTAHMAEFAQFKKQEDWIYPELLNGWKQISASPVRYFKDSFGIVHIEGRAEKGVTTNGTTIFMMPEGYVPEDVVYFPVINGRVDIRNEGEVRVWAFDTNATYLTFDSVHYVADRRGSKS